VSPSGGSQGGAVDGTAEPAELSENSVGRSGTPGAPRRGERRTLAEIRGLASEFERAAALYDLLRQADGETIDRLLREAGEIQAGGATKSIIYARYADLDPDAAAAHIVDAREDNRFLANVFASWAIRDLDAALNRADLLPPRYRRTAAIAILSANPDLGIARRQEIAERFSIQEVLNRDLHLAGMRDNPERAWRDAVAMPPGDSRTRSVWQALRAWTAVDPASALEALETWPERRVREHWRQSLVSVWARNDVRAALDWALAQPNGPQHDGLVASVAMILAKDSPLEAVEIALTLSPDQRRRVNGVAFRSWGQGDPVGALEALNDIADPQFANGMRRGLVAAWAAIDPHAAFEWARSQAGTVDHAWLLETPLAILAQNNPEAAMALTHGLDDGARRMVVPNVLKAWSESHPAAAAAWIDANGIEDREAIRAVAANFVLHDAVEAFDWVAGLPLGTRRATLPSVMFSVAQDAPATARLLVERIDDPTIRHNVAGPLVFRWVESDPQAAIRWIDRAENIGNRNRLYETAFQRWSQVDRQGAIAGMRRLPASTRESAAMGMINAGLFAHDIEFVDQVFDTLETDTARRNAARTIHARLRNTDPDLAERYRELAAR